jgi:hypothetical protein
VDCDQAPVSANLPAERDYAAEIALPLSLIGLYVSDALANSVTLGFGHRQ